MPVALLLREELLDRREDDAARRRPEQLGAQVGAVLRLHRRLPEQLLAAGEGAEELVVEVVAVGQDDERRVLHRRVGDDRARRRTPSSGSCPTPACARRRRRAGRPPPRPASGSRSRRPWPSPPPRPPPATPGASPRPRVHGVELVIAGHLLGGLGPFRLLEDDEVADEVEEAALLEHPLEDDLKLRHPGRRELLPRDRPPRHEPFLVRRERPEAGLDAVGDDEKLVEREERRDLGLVGLELLERRPDRRVLVRRVLQLDDGERQPVDEEDDVGPPVVLAPRRR